MDNKKIYLLIFSIFLFGTFVSAQFAYNDINNGGNGIFAKLKGGNTFYGDQQFYGDLRVNGTGYFTVIQAINFTNTTVNTLIFNGTVEPSLPDEFDFGSAMFPWHDGWFNGTIHANGVANTSLLTIPDNRYITWINSTGSPSWRVGTEGGGTVWRVYSYNLNSNIIDLNAASGLATFTKLGASSTASNAIELTNGGGILINGDNNLRFTNYFDIDANQNIGGSVGQGALLQSLGTNQLILRASGDTTTNGSAVVLAYADQTAWRPAIIIPNNRGAGAVGTNIQIDPLAIAKVAIGKTTASERLDVNGNITTNGYYKGNGALLTNINTYNSTYATYAYNQTNTNFYNNSYYLNSNPAGYFNSSNYQSYNATYDTTTQDVTANRSAWFSTYNSTYALYAYNQTQTSFFNSSYYLVSNPSNYFNASNYQSFNSSYATYAYNQTTPAINYLQNNYYNKSVINGIVLGNSSSSNSPWKYNTTTIYNNTDNVKVGIGTTIPTSKLDVYSVFEQSGASLVGINSTSKNFGTVGNEIATGVNGRGIISSATGSTIAYGGYFEGYVNDLGGANDAYGVYANALGGDNNYAGYFDNGNVLIQNNLSIGTNGSTYPLLVVHDISGWESAIVNTKNNAGVYLSHGGGYGAYIDGGNNTNSSSFVLNANKQGTSYLYVRGDGNVGISTTTPSYVFQVKTGTNDELALSNEGGNVAIRMSDSSGNLDRVMQRANSDLYVGDIDSNGGALLFRSNGATVGQFISGGALRVGTGSGSISTGNGDLYVTDDLEVDGLPMMSGVSNACYDTSNGQIGYSASSCTAASPFLEIYYNGKQIESKEFNAELKRESEESWQSINLYSTELNKYTYKIANHKQETDNIDAVQIIVFGVDTAKQSKTGAVEYYTLNVKNPKLQMKDGKRITLEYNESIDVDFEDLPDTFLVYSVQLMANGYYTPYSKEVIDEFRKNDNPPAYKKGLDKGEEEISNFELQERMVKGGNITTIKNETR